MTTVKVVLLRYTVRRYSEGEWEIRVSGEPGGALAMEACEPGQDGNGAAISIVFMCLGFPPRLTRNLLNLFDRYLDSAAIGQ